MFSTYIYVDRAVPDGRLMSAFALSFDVENDQVVVVGEDDYDALGDAWDDPGILLVLRRSVFSGDFPLALLLDSRNDCPEDFLAAVKTVARELGAPILTGETRASVCGAPACP